jgi:hypothetical protein
VYPVEQISAIAKDAFIYGYPIVDNYNVIYKYVLNKQSKEYKAPFNQVGHNRNIATPADTAIVSMNVDTPYSFAWLDLRAEPVVLTIPAFEKNRYVSVELIDLYTYIVGYISPRTNGNEGGNFLVTGPGWHGAIPAGIKAVFPSPTQFLLALYRTQLFNSADIDKVNALQDHYQVQTLSVYLGAPPPPPSPAFAHVKPIDVRRESESLQFFTILNAMLAYIPLINEDAGLRSRFVRIGIVPGALFVAPDEPTRTAIIEGMRQGLSEMYARAQTVRSSAELFGSREQLKDDYLSRAVGALLGIYGNSAEEFLGVGYQADSQNRPFDGDHKYQIKFSADGLPPVCAFWSITAYNASKFLITNPLNRYVINSPMLPLLKKDPDGGFTIYVQHASPGEELESNWLPVSQDAFNLAFRTYQPGQAIVDGTWQAPPVVRVE